jgi:dGTPase
MPQPVNSPLAPYAMDVSQTRGRRYSEPPHPYRNDYARDRDRVVHSRAFRRLEAKTQVFTTRYSDHFRNRLTHTLEVAQIARTVAGALNLNTDLAEALALVHDIGHPPFGHAGEHRLNQLMLPYHARFDHNLHALHIVESFEQRYLAFPGLNLTFEVREGIVKHSRDYDAAEYPELSEYLLDLRPPLESQLIDLVDEIAYNTADLDDGLEAGLITIEQIRAGSPLINNFYREIESKHPEARAQLIFNEALKRTLDYFATDLIETTRRNIEMIGIRNVDDVRNFMNRNAPRRGFPAREPLPSTGNSATGIFVAYPEPTDALGKRSNILVRRLAGFSTEARVASNQLKVFLFTILYNHPAIVEDRDRGVAALEELFRYYMDHPNAMPAFYANAAAESAALRPVPHGTGAHLVVCDYVAGMTDHFLLRTHKELLGR